MLSEDDIAIQFQFDISYVFSSWFPRKFFLFVVGIWDCVIALVDNSAFEKALENILEKYFRVCQIKAGDVLAFPAGQEGGVRLV